MKKTLLFFGLIVICTALYSQNFNYIKKITPPNTDSQRVASDNFASAVAISGNYAVIGSPGQDYDSAGANLLNGAGAAYIWERNSTTGVWVKVKKLTTSGTNARFLSADAVGNAVDISGDYCIVGAYGQDYDSAGLGFTNYAGAAYIWERNSAGAWTQVKKLSAPNRYSDDQFGWAVAISGNYAIVGAYTHDRDSANGNYKSRAGAAYIFERVNGTWGYTKKLTPPNTDSARTPNDQFGYAVDISGNYAVVGATQQSWDSAGGRYKAGAGAAYVFERRNGVWGYAKKLTPPNTDSARTANDFFGSSISIDNTTIVVGAPSQNYDSAGGNSGLFAGAAYIFERNNGAWGYIKKLTPPNTNNARMAQDNFGNGVSISGNQIIVGANGQDRDSAGGNYKSAAGAAYQFTKNNNVWGLTKKLSPPNTDSARVASDGFGNQVAVSGNNVIIRAMSQDWDSVGGRYKSDAGAAYIFEIPSCTLTYNNSWAGSSPSGSTATCICNITAGTASIAASSTLSTLTVSSGATASLSGDLSISGSYTNNGTVSGAGTIVLNGSAAQNIYGNGTTGNLQLNNSAGATVQDSLGINGVLTLTSGALTTGNKLKLEATGATTYGQIAGTGTGTISGNLTAEYLITGGGAGYRSISAPVNGATLAQLSDDYNLDFGSTGATSANTFYFDELTSPYWITASGTSASMDNRPYAVYMGGAATWANPLPITMDIAGTYNGTSDYTVSSLTLTGATANQTGWHYVRNPWPSGYTWNGTGGGTNVTINSGGIQGSQVWVYDQTAGAYTAFDAGTPGVVPPFHPFTFEVTSNNSSVTFANTGRTTGTVGNYFDKTSMPNFVEITAYDLLGRGDAAKFYTDQNTTNNYDIMDGNKMMNPSLHNLYFVQEGKNANKLVWNNIPQENEPLQLNFEAKEAGKYTISFTNENLEPITTVELKDKLSGAKHNITGGAFTFNHDMTNPKERFELRFITKSNVGIEETEAGSIYVGSTANNITIVTPQAGTYTVEVLDLLGRTIQAPMIFENAENQTQTITVNNISAGYYLVKVKGDNVFKTQKVFLK